MGGIVKRGACAAVAGCNRALKKAALMNSTDTGPGKLTGSIRIRCGFCDNTHGFV
jgi:hypothetical protein